MQFTPSIKGKDLVGPDKQKWKKIDFEKCDWIEYVMKTRIEYFMKALREAWLLICL